MAFVPPGVSPRYVALDAQTLYALCSECVGLLLLTLDNIEELSTAKGYICTRWSEAVLQLEAYLPLLASLIGHDHPVVVSYQDGLREFRKKNSVAIESTLSTRHGAEIGAIVFVYYFHVWVRGYLAMKWNSSTRLKIVSHFSDAFFHFAMTSEVSHFPDPSDVIMLRKNCLPYQDVHKYSLG